MSRRLAAWGLAALLLLAQALALDHGVRHGAGLGMPAAASAQAPAADDNGHEPGSTTCRLLDQVAQDQLATASPAWLPDPPVQAAPQPALPQGHRVATARHFQARAPPRG